MFSIRSITLETGISCLSDWTICGFDSDRKPCLYPHHVTLSFPYHVINGTRVITVHTSCFVACSIMYICKFNIAYQFGQSFDFTMVGNPSCRRFHPLLVLECVRAQVVMTSLGDDKWHLPTRKTCQMVRRTKNIRLM